MSEKVKIDEEFANYFQTKYFKNPEYFHKHPIENDPYEMTSKLVRDKNEIKRKKREDYILHNPYTGKAFYEEKNKEGTEMKTEYIILGLVGVLLFTGYAVGIAVYEASEGKSQVQRTRVLDKGSGYYVKLLPINVA